MTLKVSKTQLAATPILKGKDAEALLASLKAKRTARSIENAGKLKEYFHSQHIVRRPKHD